MNKVLSRCVCALLDRQTATERKPKEHDLKDVSLRIIREFTRRQLEKPILEIDLNILNQDMAIRIVFIFSIWLLMCLAIICD